MTAGPDPIPSLVLALAQLEAECDRLDEAGITTRPPGSSPRTDQAYELAADRVSAVEHAILALPPRSTRSAVAVLRVIADYVPREGLPCHLRRLVVGAVDNVAVLIGRQQGR